MVTDEQIGRYFRDDYRPDVRKVSDELHQELIVHTRKAKPKKILDAFRPNELPMHKQYRLNSYEPLTYGTTFRILQQFVKIRNAEDWRLEWPVSVTDNALRQYTQFDFPLHDSVENWLFNQQLTPIIDDPMGAMVVLPKGWRDLFKPGTVADMRPVVEYFDSPSIQEFTETLLIIKATEPGRDAQGRPTTVRVQYFLDADQLVRVEERRTDLVSKDASYTRTDYPNPAGFCAIWCGGFSQAGKARNYDSFLGPAVPALNESVALNSDHKVDTALHLHPERYELAQKQCPNKSCEDGLVKGPGGRSVPCATCGGTSRVAAKSPFGVLKIFTEKTGPNSGTPPITPPAGYILRPHETIKLIKELADGRVNDALFALNLEMLGGAGLNQSGTAKEYDRTEIAAYIGTIAQHIVENVLRPIYYFINRWMEPGFSDEMRKRLEPNINVPRKFDLVTADVLMQRLASLKEGGANPAAIGATEVKLAERQLGSDSIAFKEIRDTVTLDPMYGLTPEQKDAKSLNGGCSKLQYVLSSQIAYFVRRAGIETKNAFFELELDQKIAKLEEYAQVVLDKAQEQQQAALLGPGGLPQPGNPNPQPGKPQPQPAA